jgi:hypothetical protein
MEAGSKGRPNGAGTLRLESRGVSGKFSLSLWKITILNGKLWKTMEHFNGNQLFRLGPFVGNTLW